LRKEAEAEGDITLVDVAEGYEHLWRKALVFLGSLVAGGRSDLTYVMHADDDSFVRLDLLMPFLAACPRERFYWGYIWDGTGNRVTAPIRNTRNKSHMPQEQYPLDYYPPFASGCGFVLSWDLVLELTKQPLANFRLLDPPFGIHLCGPPADGYLVLAEPVVPVHDERVRPYRPLPIYRPGTLVQHYLRPEEMKPYYENALQEAAAAAAGSSVRLNSEAQAAAETGAEVAGRSGAGEGGAAGTSQGPGPAPGASPPEQLYDMLVQMGLLRR